MHVCLPTGGNRASSEVLEQDYLLPLNLFNALSSFLIKPLLDTHSPESHQRWFRLMTTARVSRSELLDILASESSVLTLDILEHLGIVFKFQSGSPGSQGDSGFTDDSVDFVIPYFLMDLALDGEDGDGNGSEGQQFVLTFQGYLSWRNYFDMLSNLSSLPSTEQVLVQGQLWSVARHSGMRLHLHWRKHSDTDSLLVSVVRSVLNSFFLSLILVLSLSATFGAGIRKAAGVRSCCIPELPALAILVASVTRKGLYTCIL